MAGTVAGVLVGRWGSARTAVGASVVMSANLAFVGLVPSPTTGRPLGDPVVARFGDRARD